MGLGFGSIIGLVVIIGGIYAVVKTKRKKSQQS
jgi:hypothetical protein